MIWIIARILHMFDNYYWNGDERANGITYTIALWVDVLRERWPGRYSDFFAYEGPYLAIAWALAKLLERVIWAYRCWLWRTHRWSSAPIYTHSHDALVDLYLWLGGDIRDVMI